jgi:hypothetical protein
MTGAAAAENAPLSSNGEAWRSITSCRARRPRAPLRKEALHARDGRRPPGHPEPRAGNPVGPSWSTWKLAGRTCGIPEAPAGAVYHPGPPTQAEGPRRLPGKASGVQQAVCARARNGVVAQHPDPVGGLVEDDAGPAHPGRILPPGHCPRHLPEKAHKCAGWTAVKMGKDPRAGSRRSARLW